MTFRQDIQGLRGLAVLSVVLFHAGITQMSGGFVGVDVFFVISGYLITGLLRKSLSDGTFSFGRFYARRARRLLPAAFTTILITYLAALYFFPPNLLERFSGEAIFATLSASNFYFWAESGYFDADAINKPLLHTWSLGVEEQFYLLWPAMLFLIAGRLGSWLSASVIGLVGLASFMLCLWAVQTHPSAAFFLTPFRIYEFAIGAVLCWLPALTKRGLLADSLYLAGLGLVLYAVFRFSENTLFPGMSALVPTIGAALMIHAGQAARLNVPTSNPVMGYLGNISYSLYLVHWPVVVFWHSESPAGLEPIDTAGILLLSLVLAAGLNAFVENRFRTAGDGNVLSPAGFGLAAALAALAFIPVAATSWAQDGWVWRMDKTLQAVNSYSIPDAEKHLWRAFLEHEDKPLPQNGKPNVLLTGDSQAADVLNILIESGMSERLNVSTVRVDARCNVVFLTPENQNAYWNRENFRTKREPSAIPRCKAQLAKLFPPADGVRPDIVIVSSLWFEHGVARLEQTIAALEAQYDAPVLVVGRKHMKGGSVGILNDWGKLRGVEAFASTMRHEETDGLNARMSVMPGIRFLNPMDYICPETNWCHVLVEQNAPVMFDQSHFSREGAWLMGNIMKMDISKHLGIPVENSDPPSLAKPVGAN
tara:strand:+ start:618 stop:2567 length:1950 start_codon:yes stop_codon:yes gene_type:complete